MFNKKLVLAVSIAALLVGVGIVLNYQISTAFAAPPAGWTREAPVSITNPGTALTDYQILINVTYDWDMQLDFDDIRFKDASGTDLPYWIESKTDGVSAQVWVRVPSIPSGGSTIYLYYGNPSAVSTSNSDAVWWTRQNTTWKSTLTVDIENDSIVMAEGPLTGTGNILRRLDGNGNVVFSTTDLKFDWVSDVAIDSTGAYILPYVTGCGSYNYYHCTGHIQKWDNNNTKLWDKATITGDGVWHGGITTDSGNNILLAGQRVPGSWNRTNQIPWVGKYDSSGTVVWQHDDQAGCDWYVQHHDVAVDSSNNVIAGGRLQGGGGTGCSGYYQARLKKLNSAGAVLWAVNPYGNQARPGSDVYGVAVNNEGKILAALVNWVPTPDSYDLKLYDSNGNLLWTKTGFDSGQVTWPWPFNVVTAVGKNFLIGGQAVGVNKAVYYLVDADNGNILHKFLLSDKPGGGLVAAVKYDAAKNQVLIAANIDTGYMMLRKHQFVDIEPTTSVTIIPQLPYKALITITNPGSALTDHQVLINVPYDSRMQADFDDLRFFDVSETMLPYWIESKTDGVSARVWVRVPSVPSGQSTIELRFGSSMATSGSSGPQTFLFFDEFSGLAQWIGAGYSWSISPYGYVYAYKSGSGSISSSLTSNAFGSGNLMATLKIKQWGQKDIDNDGDGYSVGMGDCNDNNASIYPGAPRQWNSGVDYNCSGINEYYVYAGPYSYTPAQSFCYYGGTLVWREAGNFTVSGCIQGPWCGGSANTSIVVWWAGRGCFRETGGCSGCCSKNCGSHWRVYCD